MLRFMLSIFLIFSFSSSWAKKVDLVINAGALPPLSLKNNNGFLDQLLIEAFKRIGKIKC